MKPTKFSRIAVQTDTADIQKERVPKVQINTLLNSRLMKWILGILCLAVIVTLYVLAHRSFSNSSTTTDSLASSQESTLEIEVLDGIGNMRIAQSVTNMLRSQGYDVMEMKKYNDGMIDRSYVIDRSGDLEAARKLAATLGIGPDKVFQKIDRNLYLDVTVVVGKDYSRLKVFQTLNERSKH
jgi:hypothetical protein